MNIEIPPVPRFMFTPDQAGMQLYITCTQPLALIYVHQTIPAQLYIIEGPQEPQLLRDCAAWYRQATATQLDNN